jgi:serine/threonine-protein kinase
MSDGDSQKLIGAVLQDSYRIVRLIGEGGMGAVYEGTQLRLNRRVAIKVMSRELTSNQEALGRFRREAELTSQLGHPNIVQVLDFATAPTGEPYLAMEFLEGEDLDQRLRRVGRMPLGAVASIVKQVGSALSATHAKGIVHRDLKPANIFLVNLDGDADFVKVLDFGIAKAKVAATRLTRASVVIGTPNYMAPEQAAGKVDLIDPASDQWSLAAIAYEMLAGRGPFTGDDVASLLYQVVHEEPPRLSDSVPGLPSALEKVVMRALSKKQEDRFPNIREFARAFESAAVITPGSQTVLSGSKGQARINSAPTPPPVMERPKPAPTTFSHATAELTRPLLRLKERMGRSFWGAALGLAALVVIVPTVAHRSGRPAGSSSVAPPGADTHGVTPAVQAPPPPPAPIIAPMDTSAGPAPPKTEPAPSHTGEPKKKRAARWVDPFAETAPNQKSARPSASPQAETPTDGSKPPSTPTSPTAPAKAKRRLIKEL